MTAKPDAFRYLPVVIHSEHESALDALLALDVPRDEAMDLIVAAWPQSVLAIVARVDGGRSVAAVPLPGGRWGAGNAYPDHLADSAGEAERRLSRLLKRGRRGLVARVPR